MPIFLLRAVWSCKTQPPTFTKSDIATISDIIINLFRRKTGTGPTTMDQIF